MLKVKNLSAGYRKNDLILTDVNLTIEKGEAVLVIGRNGVGKSTLARAIVNNIPFVSGEIFFDGKVLLEENKRKLETQQIINLGIGYFLQGGRVFSQLTVEENIKIASGGNDFGNSFFFNNLIDELNFIKKNWNEKATNLSLGQKHLLALAMVLVKDPMFLILDEPTAGLDDANVAIVVDIITKIKNRNGISVLLIEHRTEEIQNLADRKVEINNGKINIEVLL